MTVLWPREAARNFNRKCTQMNANKISPTYATFTGFGELPHISFAFICVHLRLKILFVAIATSTASAAYAQPSP
jgi:hypothetical protein